MRDEVLSEAEPLEVQPESRQAKFFDARRVQTSVDELNVLMCAVLSRERTSELLGHTSVSSGKPAKICESSISPPSPSSPSSSSLESSAGCWTTCTRVIFALSVRYLMSALIPQ